MAIDYFSKIIIFTPKKTIDDIHYLSTLPDTCPVCSFSISPTFILLYEKNNSKVELLCGCPRNGCASLFFAVYQTDSYSASGTLYYKHSYPLNKVKKEFSIEVEELSSDFVAIFNQAQHAELEGLDLICGAAYRKALEYLIKDYVLSMHQDDEISIKRMPLQQVIQQYINESHIKTMAERATWLGNDETHYVRKWEDRDIRDLKNLLDLTVYFISMSIKALKYQEEMNR